MKKLAIVTAALALVAVMFPAPTTWAGSGDVVIVKCSEVINTNERGFLNSAEEPKVVVFQSSSSLRPPPVCEPSTGPDDTRECATCLAEFSGRCGSLAVVVTNDRITERGGSGGGGNPNHPEDPVDPDLINFSIEKYVFACGPFGPPR